MVKGYRRLLHTASFFFCFMRYFYEPKFNDLPMYGNIYVCNHPLYDKCTLYFMGGAGLAVVRQQFDTKSKTISFGPVDWWLANDIYLSSGFTEYFAKHAAPADKNGLYPTVSARKIMWALRMNPLQKEFWENDI